jgi:hypothetical protein
MNNTQSINGSVRANRPKTLLIFDTIADASFTGASTAFVDYVINPKNGMCTLKLDMGAGIRYWSRTTADESAIRDAICGLLDKADWLPAQTACHDVTNEAPAILSRSSVEQIIAHTLKDARPEDNALTVEEFMTIRYTEA